MLIFHNTMETEIKRKLLVSQSNEITTLFYEIIQVLEEELTKMEDPYEDYSMPKRTIRSLLLNSNKCFNDFLLIK